MLKSSTRTLLKKCPCGGAFAKNFPATTGFTSGKRHLSIQEYRSAELLRKYDVGTPNGGVAKTPEEAFQVANDLKTSDLVIKAQALTGGRGKGHFDTGFKSGVHMISTPEEAKSIATEMLNHKLITKQSGEKGKLVTAVYIVERKNATKETYLSILMDRVKQMPLIISSSQGGMNIEEVAKTQPDAIKKVYIKPSVGITQEQSLEIAESLGFSSAEATEEAAGEIAKLYKIFSETDATQIEINPLSEVSNDPNRKVMCMDAKFGFDDNAAFRQKTIYSWNDIEHDENKATTLAKQKYDLNFVKLNGNVGTLVNGAGLAMATMDVLQTYGGSPANFLDCGGGATPETIEKGLELITNTGNNVKAIFVNIFGGIVRCDYVASGLVNACKNLNLDIPIVVRLQGTNVETGIETLKNSGLTNLYPFSELDPAAEKAVSFTK
ncbi:hypothetical protein TBLA_0C06560 [Henningerozyma blattae CBS 6284]|uniref:Succinate--CoA ligase [ADP-forming] subunit beta, mitochondrial n=1 Tax=Henningerozyma blattae (strain ATCC 34711 / CBS 6284 / DSM 70876 / NBRC 10599 / NRRL Y-10934 / UCD 77-7) TaxID=1071380 RepID=I2H247_HENB6|nr:hypothetical protein TBLA_0C06560 [Tetrapisispora blattae CBS 6284]CCH60449.1 hypothetical protein TBLA_0C06560 [Tetrapisispora blattae CBS 6284]